MRAEDLAATRRRRAVVERSGVDPALIEDVVIAQSYANSEAPCIGRWAALHAGLPVRCPALQIDRRCGGGLQAVITAAMTVQTGAADVVIAGGVESMSNIEHYTTTARWGAAPAIRFSTTGWTAAAKCSQPAWRFGPISGMIETAENLATGLRHRPRRRRRLRRAQPPARRRRLQAGRVRRRDRRGRGAAAPRRPRHRRPRRRRAARHHPGDPGQAAPVQPGGTVTAGNSSQQNDAAAACLVVAEDKLDDLGLQPIGFLEGWAAAGCEPSRMGIGPVPRRRKSCSARTGLHA